MSSVVGILALPVILAVGLLVIRVATVALVLTGLSRELAHFQAVSAFTGCGFTTRESELIAQHPVRRRIITVQMIIGSGVVVLAITSMVPLFINTGGGFLAFMGDVGMLAAALAVLWIVASSKWVDRGLSRVIRWALATFTTLEVHDYLGLLHLSEGFTVMEMSVRPGEWFTGRCLSDLRLGDEGIQILGILRADGSYVGTPTGHTYIRSGDTLILYGRRAQIIELEKRPAGELGDAAHARNCAERERLASAQERRDRSPDDDA